MVRRSLISLVFLLVLACLVTAQEWRPPGWRPPANWDFAMAARTLQSSADWRAREDAAQQLGGSGDMRWIAPLASAAASDPSSRVRLAAREAIDSIREANRAPDPGPPIRPRPPWGGGGFRPSDPFADMVDAWFRRYLGRSVDPDGLAARLDILRRGVDPQEVEADIIGSGEYWERHGSNVVGFIRGLYNDVLNREPNALEQHNWQQRYGVNRANRSAVAREFLQAAARELNDRRFP
jgi:hypothetical protein